MVDQQDDVLRKENARLKARVSELENGVKADALLQSITANSPSNIMLVDLNHRIEFMNHSVPGITPEELVGRRLMDLVEEQFHETIFRAFSQAAETGEPVRYETQYTSPLGVVTWWDSRVGPILEDGRVSRFVVVSSNVTEDRSGAEEQERFFNLSVDMMCVAGLDGYFKRINTAFKRTLGYDNELLERPFVEFIHPDDVESTRAVVQRLAEGEKVLDFQNRYLASSGEYRKISWRGLADMKRGVIYAVARDVTDSENLEEQLQQSRRIEAVGKLAGGIAHDFNNLLMAIQGNIELALHAPESAMSMLPDAMDACQKASELTKQLLVFSRHRTLSPRALDLGVLLDETMGLLQRLLPENISVILEHGSRIPLVLADRSQLEQVVVNLCVNARDAMLSGGSLRLLVEKLSAEQDSGCPKVPRGDYVVLSVTDTGCGMSSEVQSHIFEPFFTTKALGQGTGLGLSTVYGIVQQHHGILDVESEVGHGTTFRIFLPVTQLASGGKPVQAKSDAEPSWGGSETILLAEDEPMVQTVAVAMLRSAGYTVLTANDGLEAIEVFSESKQAVPLALLDVIMPNLGGLDTAWRLREINPDLKVIFASGHVQAEQDQDRLTREVLLAKPYRREDLLRTVRLALDASLG